MKNSRTTGGMFSPPMMICAVGPLLFGTAFVATDYLPSEPLWNAVLRVFPAGLLLIGIFPTLLRGEWFARATLLGFLNFSGFFTAQAAASHRLPGAVVATVAATQCVIVPMLLLATGQRLGLRHFLVPWLGLSGVAMLVFRGDAGFEVPGLLAAASLAVFSGVGMVLTKHWGVPPGTHPIGAVAWQMLTGGALLVLAALMVEGAPPALNPGQVAATLWLAFPATALAFAMFFGGLYAGVPATAASRLMLLGPVVAATAGWLIAGDVLNAFQIIGITLVLAAQFASAGSADSPPGRSAAEASPPTRPKTIPMLLSPHAALMKIAPTTVTAGLDKRHHRRDDRPAKRTDRSVGGDDGVPSVLCAVDPVDGGADPAPVQARAGEQNRAVRRGPGVGVDSAWHDTSDGGSVEVRCQQSADAAGAAPER